MLEAILRILLGIVVSVIAAAVLLPVTVLIGKLLRTVIGSDLVCRLCQACESRPWNVELADKVETAIIGGLIGGVVFASVQPALAPAMYDLHVESGIVDTPEPTVAVHELTDVSDSAIAERFPVRANDSYGLYVVELRNLDNRVLQNYNLNIRFPGCVAASSLGATTFGTAVISNETEQVQLGEFTNRSANATCYGAIQIDEFSASSTAIVTFVVDRTPPDTQTQRYPAPETRDDVLLTNSYAWTYNSRSYYEPAKLVAYETQGHTSTDPDRQTL